VNRPEVVALTGEALELTLDPAGGSFGLARRDGRIRFAPLLMHARVRRDDGRGQHLVSTVLGAREAEAVKALETPLGSFPGLRARVQGNLPFALRMELALLPGQDSGLCRVVVENHDQGPARVFELSPLAYRGADPGLEMGTGYGSWSFYRTGYQSWSPAGTKRVLDHDYAPRFFFPRVVGANPRTRYSRKPGEKASDWMAQLVEPGLGLSILLGFITTARQTGRVELQVRYDRFRRFEAIADADGARVDPGSELASEWLLFSLSDNPHQAQENYFRQWAKAMSARSAKPLTGWCSWYYYFWNISEDKILANLAECEAKLKGKIELFQIDDGFQPYIGEWTRWNEKFPSPPKALVDKIHAAGFKAGLWLAPFLVSRTAPLYRRHPDWVLRHERGRPVFANAHPQWKGRLMYALDCTHPGVQAWLADTIKTLVQDFGFDFLKLDFIYAAALPGKRHDPYMSGGAALRKGLELIRQAAGEKTAILGCGAPLGPAVGLVDANRVSQDVDIRWRWPMDAVMGFPISPGARNCLRNNLARALMHQKLWVNDPDCLVLRHAAGGMNLHEIRSLATVFYLLAGYLLISEDLSQLAPERLALFEQMLPLPERPAQALDLFQREFPELFFRPGQPTSLLAVFNWSREPRSRELNLSKLGIEKPCHVFEYWSQQYLGQIERTRNLGVVPAHGCRFLALTPVEEPPQVVGLDFHFGMGSEGVARISDREGGRLVLTLPGARQGRVWVAWAEGVRPVPVEFTDHAEIPLPQR